MHENGVFNGARFSKTLNILYLIIRNLFLCPKNSKILKIGHPSFLPQLGILSRNPYIYIKSFLLVPLRPSICHASARPEDALPEGG